jgi:hypothetical protein
MAHTNHTKELAMHAINTLIHYAPYGVAAVIVLIGFVLYATGKR